MAEEWGLRWWGKKTTESLQPQLQPLKDSQFPQITDASFTYLTFSGVYVSSEIREAIVIPGGNSEALPGV